MCNFLIIIGGGPAKLGLIAIPNEEDDPDERQGFDDDVPADEDNEEPTVCFDNHVVNSKLKQIYAINTNKTKNCSTKKYVSTDLHLRSIKTFVCVNNLF